MNSNKLRFDSTGTGLISETIEDAVKEINTNQKSLNILNGSATGSLRTIGSMPESEGVYTIGKFAFAEGDATKASGNYSHAEGIHTLADNSSSHAEGQETTASGQYSHAEGYSSVASNESSHAEGTGTIASGESQHAQGKYNIEDTENKYIHIVGNGINGSERSNAHTIDWSGNTWYSGIAKVGGTSFDDANAKELSTKEYVDNIDAGIFYIEKYVGTTMVPTFDEIKAKFKKITDRWRNGKGSTIIMPSCNYSIVDNGSVIFTFPGHYDPGRLKQMMLTGFNPPNLLTGSRDTYDVIEVPRFTLDLVFSDADLTELTSATLNFIHDDDNSTLCGMLPMETYPDDRYTSIYVPTKDNNPANKKYVDSSISNIAKVGTQETTLKVRMPTSI